MSLLENQSKKERITNFSAKVLKITNSDSSFPAGRILKKKKERETNHIKIQLEKNGKLEEEVILSKDVHIEIFRKDGRTESRKIDSFPFFASFFPHCSTFNKDHYKISLKETFIKNGREKERVLIESATIQWEKE